MTTTSVQYTSVFWVPSTVRITNMFGRDNAGPASKIASAPKAFDDWHSCQRGKAHEGASS